MSIRYNFNYSFVVFLAALTSVVCQASESPSSILEQSNLKKAIFCMKILESRNDIKPLKRIEILRNQCYHEDFIEHAPNIKGGRDGLLKLLVKRYKKFPELSMSIKRSASDGDLVWLHLHVKHTPDSLGGAAVQIFRMQEGKIVEHWGVGQPVPKESKNKKPMF